MVRMKLFLQKYHYFLKSFFSEDEATLKAEAH